MTRPGTTTGAAPPAGTPRGNARQTKNRVPFRIRRSSSMTMGQLIGNKSSVPAGAQRWGRTTRAVNLGASLTIVQTPECDAPTIPRVASASDRRRRLAALLFRTEMTQNTTNISRVIVHK